MSLTNTFSHKASGSPLAAIKPAAKIVAQAFTK